MEDNCRPFFVDPASRIVGTPSDAGTIAVASDEMVRPIRIALPRWYHGTDLGGFALRVNYRNAEDEEGVYLASDKVVGDDSVTFEWLLSRHVTQAAGPVRFSVCAVRHAEDGLTVAQEFNSRPAAFEVIEGLEVDEDAELEARLDWVWKVVADCEAATDAANSAIGGIDAKLEEACAAAEAEIAAAEEERAIAELGRAEAEAQRAAQFADMEQRSRGWLRYICQEGDYDPDTRMPTIAEPDAGTMYFVPSAVPTEQSMYQEWIWVSADERWESFGEVELSITPASPAQLAAVLDGTDDGTGGGEVVNLTGWRSVVPLLKNLFARITHTHSGADISDGTVTAAKLASGAVTNAKIADGSVSLAKCDSSLRDSVSQAGSIRDNSKTLLVQKNVVVNVAALNPGDCVKPSGALPSVSGYKAVGIVGTYTGKWDYSVTCGIGSTDIWCAVTNAGNKALAASTVTVYVLYVRTQL